MYVPSRRGAAVSHPDSRRSRWQAMSGIAAGCGVRAAATVFPVRGGVRRRATTSHLPTGRQPPTAHFRRPIRSPNEPTITLAPRAIHPTKQPSRRGLPGRSERRQRILFSGLYVLSERLESQSRRRFRPSRETGIQSRAQPQPTPIVRAPMGEVGASRPERVVATSRRESALVHPAGLAAARVRFCCCRCSELGTISDTSPRSWRTRSSRYEISSSHQRCRVVAQVGSW